MTVHSLRHYREKRVGLRYKAHGSVGDPCAYCGVTSDAVDHIPPIHLVERCIEIGIDVSNPRTYPACRECNSILSGQLVTSIAERRRIVQAGLRERYKKYLRIPRWDDDELEELDERFRESIRRSALFGEWIRSRLAFYSSKNVEKDRLTAREILAAVRKVREQSEAP
jgi:hypothetical protein